VHWLTDVIAGALLGSGISLFVFALAQLYDSRVADRVLGRRASPPRRVAPRSHAAAKRAETWLPAKD
jgi:membrane-associated phospholipid phosphatase